jgi:YidC/Oxa1 family membrane protein insertase
MKFYKENGVNPLAGCLPMIPQMIVFFSLFSVLRFIADWKHGSPLKYGFTQPIVESAQEAKIFGVHLGDKLLFAHPAPPLHVAIVIALTVVVSATTTFMTVRQSAKRGLMQTGTVDPDNPMAQSQKYMQYIVPFFSLTGLYWQYGLVLYWVTTNLWTLGQQYFMFRNWEPIGAAASSATASASTGAPARTAPSPARSGTSRPGPSGSAAARQANGAARTAGTAKAAGSAKTANGARNGTSTGRTSAQAAARIKAASASSGTRTGTSSRPAATSGSAPKATPDTGQNDTPKRGFLGLGRAKAEPEPQDDVPATKVVRQQPVRQARSKRSGKR